MTRKSTVKGITNSMLPVPAVNVVTLKSPSVAVDEVRPEPPAIAYRAG
jgi:hypothetical protein